MPDKKTGDLGAVEGGSRRGSKIMCRNMIGNKERKIRWANLRASDTDPWGISPLITILGSSY